MVHDCDRVAVVTGATGFVGSHLANTLCMNGWTVHSIVRKDSATSHLLPSVHRRVHDGTTESLVQILHDASPEIVFHLASYYVAEHRMADIVPLIQTNLMFSTQLLEAMNQCDVHYMVNTGTSWQHYNDEDYNPVCLYAASKQAFEAMVKFYTDSTPLSVITLKLFDTFGPLDYRPKLFQYLRESAKSGEHIKMSPGEQLLDLVYIDDVVDAFLIAARKLTESPAHTNEQYAISSGHNISLRGLVSLYSRILGLPIHVNWGERAYRYREVMIPWAHGASLPEWKPRFTLEEGIRIMEQETRQL